MPKPTRRDHNAKVCRSKEAAQSLVTPALRSRTPLRMVDAVAAVHALSDANLDHLSRSTAPPPVPLACKPACDHCCHIRTSGNFPEVHAVAHLLKTSLPGPELEALRAELRAYAALTRGKTFAELPTAPCPFLKDSKCSVRPARPNSCRRFASYSAEACRASRANSWQDRVPASRVHHHASELPHLGLVHALARLGLCTLYYELAPAVEAVLHDPTLADRFLAGETVLHDLVIPDAEQHSHASLDIVTSITAQDASRLLAAVMTQEYHALSTPAALQTLSRNPDENLTRLATQIGISPR